MRVADGYLAKWLGVKRHVAMRLIYDLDRLGYVQAAYSEAGAGKEHRVARRFQQLFQDHLIGTVVFRDKNAQRATLLF